MKTEQDHKGIETRDAHSSHAYRSKSCAALRLWCVSLCRGKKKCSERVLAEPTRRFLKHVTKKKKRSEECGKRDEAAVAGVSTDVSHRESISPRSGPEKSKRSRKQDETVEVAEDKEDISVDVGKERSDRKKRKTREEEERERKERKRRERREKKERRERREHEQEILHLADTRVSARYEDPVVEDHIPRKAPPTDLTKNCCYLCAENTLAIAASKPEQSDKGVQVSAHKFRTETFPMLDKSCSPLLLVRIVQSSVKVRMRETGTLCPDASAPPRKETRTKKRKKFNVFPRLTRTKCPAGRNAACETDKLASRRDDNTEKRELRIEKCCMET